MPDSAFTFHRGPIDDFVARLTEADRLQIVLDYDDFSRMGKTGDTLLRKTAKDLIDLMSGSSITFDAVWMTELANACHRFNSMQVIEMQLRQDGSQIAVHDMDPQP